MAESLAELSEKLQAFARQFSDVDLEDDEVLQDTKAALDEAFEDKAEAYAVIIENLKMEKEKDEQHIKKWQAKKKRADNRIKWLREQLLTSMEQTGKTKFKTNDWSFYTINRQAVDVVDESLIPAEFIKVETQESVMKKDVLKALKAGKEVPGAIIKNTESLNIR